jgi:hypothetical protein
MKTYQHEYTQTPAKQTTKKVSFITFSAYTKHLNSTAETISDTEE